MRTADALRAKVLGNAYLRSLFEPASWSDPMWLAYLAGDFAELGRLQAAHVSKAIADEAADLEEEEQWRLSRQDMRAKDECRADPLEGV